ncbi:MAG: Hsp20/alpha crystallin family protein [Planctomycetes bacterium]|nr:Hsp20/alpha crystallin family protein [Planctomycetota bacterium]
MSQQACEVPAGTELAQRYLPRADLIEAADEFRVVAELPGVKAGDVQVDFSEGTLTVSARVPRRHPEGARVLLGEYGVGDFRREFRIAESAVDAARIAGELKDGVLILHLPKPASRQPRRIEIEAR